MALSGDTLLDQAMLLYSMWVRFNAQNSIKQQLYLFDQGLKLSRSRSGRVLLSSGVSHPSPSAATASCDINFRAFGRDWEIHLNGLTYVSLDCTATRSFFEYWT